MQVPTMFLIITVLSPSALQAEGNCQNPEGTKLQPDGHHDETSLIQTKSSLRLGGGEPLLCEVMHLDQGYWHFKYKCPDASQASFTDDIYSICTHCQGVEVAKKMSTGKEDSNQQITDELKDKKTIESEPEEYVDDAQTFYNPATYELKVIPEHVDMGCIKCAQKEGHLVETQAYSYLQKCQLLRYTNSQTKARAPKNFTQAFHEIHRDLANDNNALVRTITEKVRGLVTSKARLPHVTLYFNVLCIDDETGKAVKTGVELEGQVDCNFFHDNDLARRELLAAHERASAANRRIISDACGAK